MEIRIFQILVPLFALVFIISQITRHLKSKATNVETIVSIGFWLSVGIFAIFPDAISNSIAAAFGIKSNINAVLFLSIGIIFFVQFKMYSLIKKQENAITVLTRKIALKEQEKQQQ
ncbi:MAG: DUF2304 family protein [Bacteroidota bacterium]